MATTTRVEMWLDFDFYYTKYRDGRKDAMVCATYVVENLCDQGILGSYDDGAPRVAVAVFSDEKPGRSAYEVSVEAVDEDDKYAVSVAGKFEALVVDGEIVDSHRDFRRFMVRTFGFGTKVWAWADTSDSKESEE